MSSDVPSSLRLVLLALLLIGSSALSFLEELPDSVSLLQTRAVEQRGPSKEPASAATSLAEESPRKDHGGRKGARPAPATQAVINLDLPPRKRWKDFFSDEVRRQEIIAHMSLVGIGSVEVLPFLALGNFTEYEEFLEEHRGIVEAVGHPSVTTEALLWTELAYEMAKSSFCSAVLVALPDGQVLHGRNLDIGNITSVLQASLTDFTFTRGGKPVFVSTNNPGSVGVHTGYRVGKFSVAQNTRTDGNAYDANLLGASQGGRPFMFLLRRVLQDLNSFSDAVHTLSSVPLMAPQYFTVAGAGPNEGAVVTRGRDGSPVPWANAILLNPPIQRWFLVQTNEDSHRHRQIDRRRMDEIDQLSNLTPADMSFDKLQELLLQEPVNNCYTVFTWVLEPSTGKRKLIIDDAAKKHCTGFLFGRNFSEAVPPSSSIDPARLRIQDVSTLL